MGITIDSTDLKFHYHIVLLEHKISRTIGILSKLRHFLPQSALLKIYYALIHCQLMYGLPISGSTFSSFINKLKSLQNKAVKTIKTQEEEEEEVALHLKVQLSFLINSLY